MGVRYFSQLLWAGRKYNEVFLSDGSGHHPLNGTQTHPSKKADKNKKKQILLDLGLSST